MSAYSVGLPGFVCELLGFFGADRPESNAVGLAGLVDRLVMAGPPWFPPPPPRPRRPDDKWSCIPIASNVAETRLAASTKEPSSRVRLICHHISTPESPQNTIDTNIASTVIAHHVLVPKLGT